MKNTTATLWGLAQKAIDTRVFFDARREFLQTSRPEVAARRYMKHVNVIRANQNSISRILSDYLGGDTFREQAARSILAGQAYPGEPNYAR